ncbi:MAG: alpha/beta fold hydrolase [Saprospiraceae bacterium]
MSFILRLIRIKYRILSVIFPGWAANSAFKLFQKPHNFKIREREKDFLAISEIYKIENSPEDLIFYRKGNHDGERVLMIHGWDSNPGSMSGIAEKLVENGFNVFAFNVPAHGISKVESTNMLEVSDLLVTAVKKLSENGKINAVTHSFGSGAISFALEKSDIELNKMVFVTTPDKISDIFYDFASKIDLSEKSYKKLLEMTSIKFNRSMDDLAISNLLSNAKYNKLLLIHDKNDKILPFKNSISIKEKNKNVEIFQTKDTGHYRILWDENVIEKVNEFMKN